MAEIFMPAQWFKGKAGKAAATKLLGIIKCAFLAEPAIKLLEESEK
jgi:hypothetical protein